MRCSARGIRALDNLLLHNPDQGARATQQWGSKLPSRTHHARRRLKSSVAVDDGPAVRRRAVIR